MTWKCPTDSNLDNERVPWTVPTNNTREDSLIDSITETQ